MKKPTARYRKGEIGEVRIVEDFLPAPDQLMLRDIRALVDAYTEKQGGKG